MRPRIWPALAVSGGLGFLFGAFGQPTWQDVIEPAQVLAGVVTYPADNPVYLYSTRTWTILHQVVALWIAVGVPERLLAIVISGLIGVLAFQSLAMTTLAMGGGRWIAALAPVLILVSRATQFEIAYPLDLLGREHTYGLVALPLLLLTLSLLADGRDRSGPFLLGVLPAAHVVVGLWAWVIVLLLAVPFPREWRRRAKDGAGWFLLGLVVTLVSAAVHVAFFASPAPPIPPGGEQAIHGAKLYWDGHRAGLDLTHPGAIAAIALPMCWLVWMQRLEDRVPPFARWLPVSLLIGVTIAVVSERASDWLPGAIAEALRLAMPARLLNVPLLAGVAVALGLATAPSAPALTRVVASAGVAGLSLANLAALPGIPVPTSVLRQIAGTLVRDGTAESLLIVVILVAVVSLVVWLPAKVQDRLAGLPVRAAQRTMEAGLAMVVVFSLADVALHARANLAGVVDRTNNALFLEASRRPGLLLTASDMHLVQAATRRPVLVDGGAINALAYVPEAAPIIDRIARRAYGLTLTMPAAPDGVAVGAFPETAGRDAWMRWSLEDWQAIREEFGVTDVLTPATWQVKLPLVARDSDHALWTIPTTISR